MAKAVEDMNEAVGALFSRSAKVATMADMRTDIPVSFRLDPETVALIRAIAAQNALSQADAIRIAVRAYARANAIQVETAPAAKRRPKK